MNKEVDPVILRAIQALQKKIESDPPEAIKDFFAVLNPDVHVKSCEIWTRDFYAKWKSHLTKTEFNARFAKATK